MAWGKDMDHEQLTFSFLQTGIGAACALALAQAGANLCLIFRPLPNSTSTLADYTVSSITALCPNVRVEVVHCDLGNTEDVKTVFPRALDLMGGEIDVFVNCAGIQRRDQAVKFSETDWDDVSLFFSFGSSLFFPRCFAFLSFGFFAPSLTGVICSLLYLSLVLPALSIFPFPSLATHPSPFSAIEPA